jgi:adenylate cyclase class 2
MIFMPSYTETEVKLYVPDLDAARARLQALDALLTVPRVYERNVRYENSARTLTASGIVVRLRQDTRTRLTYKEGAAAANGIVSRTEIEVEVSDFAAMEAILARLGYFPHLVYEKYRTTFQLDNCEIVLDEMPYGSFVEIEGEAAAIETLIPRLGLESALRCTGSYMALFERVKQQLGLTFTDLTFANFAGIAVPASAFEG